ncbi:MAG: hypothetical protein RR234_09395, partial [Christensenella sp.]
SAAFGTPLDKFLAKGNPREEWSVAAQAREKQRIGAERFKEGLGAGGRAVADIAIGAGNLAGDLAVTAATGVPISAYYGVTGGAEAAQKALGDGYGAGKSMAAGTASGIITSQIERLGGVGGNLAGKYIGKLAGTSVGKLMVSKAPKVMEYIGNLAGTKAGKILGSAASEGLEEFTEYDVQRVINNLILDKDTPRDVKEQLYNTVMGAGIGGLFGAASSMTAKPQTATNAPTAAADTTAQQQAHTPTEAQGDGLQAAPHTPEMQRVIEEYNSAVDDGVVAFTEKVQNLQDRNVASKLNLGLGEVRPREVEDIKKATGIDTSGYTHNMNGETVYHIDRRHGTQGEHDTSMADVESVGRISYVLSNYDNLELLKNKKGNTEQSSAFKNSNGQPSAMVRYWKRIDGTYYVVEAVPDSNAKKVQVVSAYIQKAKKEAPQVVNAFAPTFTSENGLASTSYDTTIPQGKNGVNTQYMQNGVNNAAPVPPFDTSTVSAVQTKSIDKLAALEQERKIKASNMAYIYADYKMSTEDTLRPEIFS